jgi:hypothetical protein
MSKIEVDTIEPQSGTSLTLGASGDTITIPSGATLTNSGTATGFGKVLQVVSTTKTDTFTTSSTSYTDVTGLSVSITPASASNKILVIVDINGSAADQSFVKLLRGSTDINIGTSAGSREVGSGGDHYNVGSSQTVRNSSFSFLDSPSTTSATTYKIQAKAATAVTFGINRSSGDADNGNSLRTTSNITAIEIAG